MDTTVVKALISFEAKDEDTLRSYLNHHLEYLIDFNDIDDICQSAGNVLSYTKGENGISEEARILRSVATDILAKQQSNEEDSELFEELRRLMNVLSRTKYWEDI